MSENNFNHIYGNSYAYCTKFYICAKRKNEII